MAMANSTGGFSVTFHSRAIDTITRKIQQSIGIIDLMGNLDQNDESLDDHSMNNASWAAKDLLKECLAIIGEQQKEKGAAAADATRQR